MKSQPEINEKMRAVLVDWMIDTTTALGFCADTTFSSVKVLDQFLTIRKLTIPKLQLAGVTSIIISAKF